MGSFSSFRPLVAVSLLLLAGCGARTSFRDDSDAGFAVGLDVIAVVDVPITKPLDVPTTRPLDVPITRPVDVFVPPPIDVPITTPVDVPITTPVDVPRVGVTCETAIPASPMFPLANQDTTGLPATHLPCETMGADTLGAPLWYRVIVPAGQTLTALVSNDSPMRPFSVRIQASCAATRCLAQETPSTDPRIAAARWSNTGDAPAEVFVAIGSHYAGLPARFTLVPVLGATAPNAACAAPTRVMNGTRLVEQNLTLSSAASPWCPGSGGNALFYAVRVGAGEQLTVRAANSAGPFSGPGIRLGTACDSAACLAVSENDAAGALLRYTNTTGAAQELLFAVDANGRAPFLFNLAVDVGPPPYTVTRTSVSCDDLSVGRIIATAIGDDVGTTAIPLPIRFPYFGAAIASWSVSTNGYLQVWPTDAGMSAGALGVTALPSAAAPGNMIAPFWEDLEVRAAEMMDVRWRVFDTRDRHVTVQWTDVGLCCGAGAGNPARMTFQAKLFEGTGVIEFHYCAQTSDMRARGSGASAGVQDATGARGVSAFFRSGDVTPMTAYRLTPN